MLEINTRDFGKEKINEEDILIFPKGIFAFEETKKYAVLSPIKEEAAPLWLQSISGEELCFIIFNTEEILQGYSPNPEKEDLKTIEYEDGDDIAYYAIAVIPEDYKNTTINLKSPIIINKTKKLGVQTILPQNYDLRHKVFDQIS